MKKLSLKRFNLNTSDLLEKEALKTITGGYGGYGETTRWIVCFDQGNGKESRIFNSESAANTFGTYCAQNNWLRTCREPIPLQA